MGATTFGIIKLGITTKNATLGIITLGITTKKNATLSIIKLFITTKKCDTQHNHIGHNNKKRDTELKDTQQNRTLYCYAECLK